MNRKRTKTGAKPRAIKIVVKRHIAALGFSKHEYFRWCEDQRLEPSFEKPITDLEKELRIFRDLQKVREQQLRLHHNPERFLKAVILGEIDPKLVTRTKWRDISLAVSQAPQRGGDTLALCDFILTINRRSKIVFDSVRIGTREYYCINALIQFHEYRGFWVRDFSTWKPKTKNALGQFRSLLSHLFDTYTVPIFMQTAWLRSDKASLQYRHWYMHLAAGRRLRDLKLPIIFTKRMAHLFTQAPDGYSIEHALKWGAIRAMGGDDRLCEAVLQTRLGETHKAHDFWVSVYRFFIANPMLDRRHVGPVIDYIYQQKFVVHEFVTEHGTVERIAPPQPGFSMSGRTPSSLLRQVERWHGSLGKQGDVSKTRFRAVGYPGFVQKTGEDKHDVWRITQLLSGAALVKEGRDMKHCVASYARACASGACSIWSLEYVSPICITKHITIEVNKQKVIVQCRGMRNRFPNSAELDLITKWANSVGLTLSPYLAGNA